MSSAKITKSLVDRQEPGTIIWDSVVKGFGSRRQREGVYYILRYRFDRAQRQVSIGRHGSPWTVEKARREAQRLLGQAIDGSDPSGPSSAELFGVEVERYLERKRPTMKPRSYEEVSRHLLVHAKPLHPRRLSEIDRRAIAIRLAEIETASGPVARNLVRSSLSAFFSFCIREGLLDLNPVAGTGKAETNGSRSRVLTPKEIAKIWTTMVAGQHVHFVDAVRLLLLTGQRRNEIGGLMWSEVDFESRCLRLGEARTKNRREHIVPLAKPAIEILRRCWLEATPAGRSNNDGPSNNTRVFRSFSWSTEKARLDRGLKIEPPWRIHDLRRTVATSLGDLGIAAPHIVETILNHVSGHRAGVAGVYQRAKYETECRAALEAWGEWIEANAR
jgi:integrase